MTLTLKVATRSCAIREFGNDQCFPVAGDPIPLEGMGD